MFRPSCGPSSPARRCSWWRRVKAGSGSFCVPRAAIEALVAAQADSVIIGAYLVLAAGTDESGMYSTWSVSAIRRCLGVNRDRAQRALERLTQLKVQFGRERSPLVVSRAWYVDRYPET